MTCVFPLTSITSSLSIDQPPADNRGLVQVRLLHALLRCSEAHAACRKLVTVDEQKINLELLDTAGTEQFTSLHSLYLRTGDAFLLVFSLTSIDSVNALTEVRQQVRILADLDSALHSILPDLAGQRCGRRQRGARWLLTTSEAHRRPERRGHRPLRQQVRLERRVSASDLLSTVHSRLYRRTVPRDVGVALSGLWNGALILPSLSGCLLTSAQGCHTMRRALPRLLNIAAHLHASRPLPGNGSTVRRLLTFSQSWCLTIRQLSKSLKTRYDRSCGEIRRIEGIRRRRREIRIEGSGRRDASSASIV